MEVKMVNCASFYNALVNNNVSFFAGVPDSLLKDFCAYITDHASPENHIIAANEGGAVALACGHYLATGKPGLVYMQNSGQGNVINPLASLTDPEVYGVPLLLLVGWRGEPGKKDEPQHIKQGKVTLGLFDVLDIPYEVLPGSDQEAEICVNKMIKLAEKSGSPVAIIVKKGAFDTYQLKNIRPDIATVTREEAIELIAEALEPSDVVVSTTGKVSRELYEFRERTGRNHEQDFLTVGSMGHASQIAMGIALSKKSRQVYCFDGDGAAIMHMGSFAIIGSQESSNFKQVIFNNGAHDSVGGQPTVGMEISFVEIAKASGYSLAMTANSADEIPEKMAELKAAQGPALLEVKVRKGSREDLGRPKESPQENKKIFMEFLSK
jgi:phosphonopyruvate decarboxylase